MQMKPLENRRDSKMSLIRDVVILIPCHNEEATVVATIEEVRRIIPLGKIIVIDNLSDDNTAILATKAGSLVISEPQKGKGFAVRKALSQIDSTYRVVFMIDGDATYSVQNFWKAYDQITQQGYDMVVGKRMTNTSFDHTRKREFRFGHRIGNNLLSKTFSSLFGLKQFDSLSGWRVMSIGFSKSFFGGASGFELEAELNSHAFLLQAPVCEIPVEYRGRVSGSSSKLNTYRDGARILRMYMSLFRAERPLMAYSFLGFPWLIFSLVLITQVVSVFFESGTVPNFPSLIAGVGAFTVASLLWATGMILQKVRLARVSMARWAYSQASEFIGQRS
jgi:glycosyltransferase involved in cell wall biosynthesis